MKEEIYIFLSRAIIRKDIIAIVPVEGMGQSEWGAPKPFIYYEVKFSDGPTVIIYEDTYTELRDYLKR